MYEVIWIRKLGLVFGTTNLALSTVLAAFFGGLALGSYLFGRLAERSRNLIRLYAYLEIAIGVYAFLFPVLVRVLDQAYALFYQRMGDNFPLLALSRMFLLASLIIVPTAFMGGTLPILSRHFVEAKTHLSARLGGLYAVNTLGGALGAFVCGFYLIHFLGVDGTNYWAGGLNVAVGAIAWSLSRQAPTEKKVTPRQSTAGRSGPATQREEKHAFSPRLVALAILAFGVSGFTAIAYEVVWARYLSLFLMNSIYTYSTMLTVFLLGLVAGSILFARFFDRAQNLIEIFGYVQVGIGITSLLLLPALLTLQAPVGRYTGNLFLFQFGLSMVLMILPTTLMGATFPLVSRIVTVHVRRVSRFVGTLYAVNTVGAILGSILAGFLLVPWLGIGGSVRLLAAVNVCLGLAAMLVEPRPHHRRNLVLVIGMLLIGLGSEFVLGEKIPETRLQQIAGGSEKIVAVKEGRESTVWVTVDGWGRKALWTNTSVMGRTGRRLRNDLSAQRLQGHIPMVLHRGVPKEVLGIGFGTGQTFGAQLLYPIERIDAVDISRTVVDLALEHFGEHQNGFGTDPRAHVIIDDGRNFIMRTNRTYDVITLEMPPHEEAGIVHFYTQEFYRKLRGRLRTNGIVAQWVPIYNVTPSEARGIIRTFIRVFPHSALWYNSTNLLLLGFEGELRIDGKRVQQWLQREAIFADLSVSYLGTAPSSLNRIEYFLAGFLMGPQELSEFSRGATIYTDRRPELEFTWTEFPVWGPKRKDLLVLENTLAIEAHLGKIDPYLVGEKDQRMISNIQAIQRSYINQLKAVAFDNLGSHYLAQGLIEQSLAYYQQAIGVQPSFAQAHNNLGSLYLRMGRTAEALSAYRKAIRIDPDYAEAHYNLGLAYTRQGSSAKALSAYREAIRVRPDFAQAYLNLALLFARSGEIDKAIETVEELLKRVPGEQRGRELRRRLGQMKKSG